MKNKVYDSSVSKKMFSLGLSPSLVRAIEELGMSIFTNESPLKHFRLIRV